MAILHHMGTLRLCASIHLLATCLMLAFPRAGQEPVEQSPDASQWYALLVGCDEYPNLQKDFPAKYESELRLLGPANDVALMRDALVQELGVPEEHITTLVGGWDPIDKARQPTRRNIQAQLRELKKRVSEGDRGVLYRVVLYFSGHGSQQRDAGRKGDPEPDGLDEVFLPADVKSQASAQGRIPNSLADDELGQAARDLQAAGAQVWLIFDCCHAATMARGGARSRGLDPALFGVDVTAGARGAIGPEPTLLTGQTLGNIVAMYASRSDARAPEMSLPEGSEDAKPHGLFTWTLVEQLHRRDAAWTFRDLQGAILESYRASGGVVESLPVAEGGLNLYLETGLAGTMVERWHLVAGKLGTPRGFPLILLGADGKTLPEGAARDAVMASLEPFGERLELVDGGSEATTITQADSGLTVHPGGAGELDLLGLEASELIERLGGLDLLHVAQNAVADGWADPLEGVELRVEFKRAGRGKYLPLAPGGVLNPGDKIKISLIKPEGAIFDINVLHVDAGFRVNSLYPVQGDTTRLEASDSEPIELLEDTVEDAADAPLGREHLIVFAVPHAATDLETNLALRALEAVPQVGVVEIVTEWPSVGPPGWPRRGLVELSAPLTTEEGSEAAGTWNPWAIDATHAALTHGRGVSTLLLGDAEGPRYAFVGPRVKDKDPVALIQNRSFEAYAVFHYLSDRRVAFYDSGGDGLDLVLIDDDLDGIADVRCERSEGAEWRVSAPVVLPWLSQGHLSPWQGHGEAPKHFSALVR